MGSYEKYEPPSELRSGISLIWVVAAVGVVGVAGSVLIYQRAGEADRAALNVAVPADLASAESEPDTTASTGSLAGQDASPYAKDARIAELEMQLRDKDFELSRRRSEIESLEQRVSQLQLDSERYRDGLDQAVAELNQLRGEIGRLESASGPGPSGQAGPRQSQGVSPVGPPYVTISPMGFVTVSGFVNNPTRYASRGKLQVSLVGSAGVIESRDFPMYIPPNKQERYDVTFPGIFPTERIAAQARWVP
ncbi:MAG: hypothetical protein WBP34_06640 [Thermoanaerobaculia bacterium]